LQRSPALPDVPAINETLKGFSIDTWWGLVAPAATPREVLERLNKAFTDALRAAETRQRFAQLLAEPVPTSPEQFGEFMKAELAKYQTVVKASGARVD
jgi:tripartite-type tricarboxylate transporter receptor subunit TctC